MHGDALKLKYRQGNETEKMKGKPGGARGHGVYSTRTGNSHGATGGKWKHHEKHPIGMSGRTLSGAKR